MPDELSLVTPVNDNFRRDVELADSTLLDPTEADALLQGEWLAPDGAGTHKWVRAVAGTRGAKQLFSPKGDTSAQAIGKVAVIQLHEYEADTTIFDDAYVATVGDLLTVAIITLDGVAAIHSGLREATVTGDVVYGIVTRTPAVNGSKLRFEKAGPGIGTLIP